MRGWLTAVVLVAFVCGVAVGVLGASLTRQDDGPCLDRAPGFQTGGGFQTQDEVRWRDC
jgi:hypothetical protein